MVAVIIGPVAQCRRPAHSLSQVPPHLSWYLPFKFKLAAIAPPGGHGFCCPSLLLTSPARGPAPSLRVGNGKSPWHRRRDNLKPESRTRHGAGRGRGPVGAPSQ